MYTLTLVDFSTPEAGASPVRHPITKDYITIGRGKENDIVVIQTDISKRHAAVRVTNQGIYLEDLGSTNGTVLNDLPVTSPVRIYDDDQIHIGLARITLSDNPLLQRGGAPRDFAPNDDVFPSASSVAAPPSHAPQRLPSIPDIPPLPGPSMNMSGGEAGSPFPFLENEHLSSGGISTGRPSFPFEIPAEPPLPSPQGSGTSNLIEKIRRIESQAMKSRPPAGKPSVDLVDKIKEMESRALSQAPAPAARESAPPRATSVAPRPVGPVPTETTETAIIVTASIPEQETKVAEFTKRSIIVGRAPESDLCLPQPLVSSRHAVIELSPASKIVLRDIGSTNGTFVNHEQITSPTIVGPGDEIFIGDCRLFVSVGEVPIRDSREEPAHGFPAQPAAMPTVEPPPNADVRPFVGPSAARINQATLPAEHAPPYAPPGPYAQNIPDASATAPQPARGPLGGILDLAVLLTTARKALGATLELIQARGEDIPKTRRLCAGIAKAAAALYRVRGTIENHGAIQAAADEAAAHLRRSLAAFKEERAFTEAEDRLIRALALLYPLTSENQSHPDGAAPLWNALRTDIGPRVSPKGSLDDTYRDPEMEDHLLVAHAVFRAENRYLQAARRMARSIADNYYLDEQQTLKLESAVDEACSNVVDHAFEDSEQGAFSLSFYTDPAEEVLTVNIDDRGLPFDANRADSGHMDGMGISLMRAFCRSVRFTSRGRRGKRVRLEMELPGSMSGFFSTFSGTSNKEKLSSALSSQYRIEDLDPGRAEEISRSVFRACGYDYYDEDLYDIPLLRSELQNNTRLTVVAFSDRGAAVGQASVVLPAPGAVIGELGPPIAASSLLGGSIPGQLTQRLVERCRQEGLRALTSRLSTAHPYEQIAFNNLGAVPTGIVLGAFPDDRKKDAPCSRRPRRLSRLDVFLALGTASPAAIHAPARHIAVLQEIYRACRIDRTFSPATDASAAALSEACELSVHTRPWGSSNVKIEVYGRDCAQRLDAVTKELSLEAPYCITVDMPMSHPAAVALAEHLEPLGYTFSGVALHPSGHDILRLQKTAGFTPDPIELHVEGNLGKQILEHVMRERARVLGGA